MIRRILQSTEEPQRRSCWLRRSLVGVRRCVAVVSTSTPPPETPSPFKSRLGTLKRKAELDDALLAVAERQQQSTTMRTATRTLDDPVADDPLRDRRVFNRVGQDDGATAACAGGDVLRRRLVFQARYRGMHEMDMIFNSFVRDCISLPQPLPSDTNQPPQHVHADLRVADSELPWFDAILREYDNDLHHWLVDVELPIVKSSGGGYSAVPVAPEDDKEEQHRHTSVRGAVPERLHSRNPVWEKLVRYITRHGDRILSHR